MRRDPTSLPADYVPRERPCRSADGSFHATIAETSRGCRSRRTRAMWSTSRHIVSRSTGLRCLGGMPEHSTSNKVVVIGGGYAGALAANRLRKRVDVDITLINPRAKFVDRVRLHQFVAGTGEAEVDYGTLLADEVELVVDSATRIDTAARTVELASGGTLDYDYIIYASRPGRRLVPNPACRRRSRLDAVRDHHGTRTRIRNHAVHLDQRCEPARHGHHRRHRRVPQRARHSSLLGHRHSERTSAC